MASKKVLVTGGAGFIGGFLVDQLVKDGHAVTILDNLDAQAHPDNKGYINREAEFLKINIRDYEKMAEVIPEFEVIFHEASCVGIGQSNYNIRDFVHTNTLGTANILDILANKSHSVKKLIIAGSNTSYGEGLYKCKNCGIFHPGIRSENDVKKYGFSIVCPKCRKEASAAPTTEETELLCNSIYSYTKRDQEDMASFFGRMYNLPVTILRYFNVFGPRQSLSNPYTGVIAIFISRIKNNNCPVIYEDGLQTRDFVSVHDAVRANILAMKSNSANNQTFNVGTGEPKTILSVAETLIQLSKKNLKPEVTNKFRKGDIRHCIADISKIKNTLGWQPKTNFDDGLKELLAWSEKEACTDNFEKAARELKEKGLY